MSVLSQIFSFQLWKLCNNQEELLEYEDHIYTEV